MFVIWKKKDDRGLIGKADGIRKLILLDRKIRNFPDVGTRQPCRVVHDTKPADPNRGVLFVAPTGPAERILTRKEIREFEIQASAEELWAAYGPPKIGFEKFSWKSRAWVGDISRPILGSGREKFLRVEPGRGDWDVARIIVHVDGDEVPIRAVVKEGGDVKIYDHVLPHLSPEMLAACEAVIDQHRGVDPRAWIREWSDPFVRTLEELLNKVEGLDASQDVQLNTWTEERGSGTYLSSDERIAYESKSGLMHRASLTWTDPSGEHHMERVHHQTKERALAWLRRGWIERIQECFDDLDPAIWSKYIPCQIRDREAFLVEVAAEIAPIRARLQERFQRTLVRA